MYCSGQESENEDSAMIMLTIQVMVKEYSSGTTSSESNCIGMARTAKFKMAAPMDVLAIIQQ